MDFERLFFSSLADTVGAGHDRDAGRYGLVHPLGGVMVSYWLFALRLRGVLDFAFVDDILTQRT